MSDFWADRLQGLAPPPPAPPQSQQDLLRPWYQPAPLNQPVAQQPADPASPEGETTGHDRLADLGYSTSKAQSAKNDDRCPDCGSGNYLHIAGQQHRPLRCYDCGYNPFFSHSTAGISTHNSDIPVQAARSQTGNVNNFNPRHIIAHIG